MDEDTDSNSGISSHFNKTSFPSLEMLSNLEPTKVGNGFKQIRKKSLDNIQNIFRYLNKSINRIAPVNDG